MSSVLTLVAKSKAVTIDKPENLQNCHGKPVGETEGKPV